MCVKKKTKSFIPIAARRGAAALRHQNNIFAHVIFGATDQICA